MSHQPESPTSQPNPNQNPKTEPPSPQKATIDKLTSSELLYSWQTDLENILIEAQKHGEVKLEGPTQFANYYIASIYHRGELAESSFWARGRSDSPSYALIHAIEEAIRLSRP